MSKVVHAYFPRKKRTRRTRMRSQGRDTGVPAPTTKSPNIAFENTYSHKRKSHFQTPEKASPLVSLVPTPRFSSEGHSEATFGALGEGRNPLQASPMAKEATEELLLGKRIPLDRNPAAVYLASLGKGSRRTMKQALEVIASLLTGGRAGPFRVAWHLVRFQHTSAVRSALTEKYAIPTANKILAALRGTLKAAWRLALMNAEDFHRAIDIPSVRGETLPRGRALSSGEILALFDACDDSTKAGTRDAALFALLYGVGARRSETVAIDLKDFNRESGELTIRQAKGGKQRIVYSTDGGLEAMRDWLGIRGDTPGRIFCPINKGDRLDIRPMTDQAVLNLCRKRALQAGVKNFSPHDLRRSFVSHLLDKGADISAVKALAGHASVQTTARYDRRGEAAKKTAAALLHVPYRGKTPALISDPSKS